MLIKIQNLTKNFNDLKIIDNLNFKIDENEIVALIGPSGCGKSTFLNIISGLISEYEGEFESNNPMIGYVFQEDRLLPWLNVVENIKIVNDQSDDKVRQLINEVGLSGFENSFPYKLSGGMRQRCAIARGFNYDCNLLLMDEPFKSLDYNLRIDMLNMLVKLWNKKKKAILFVTHEIDEALLVANRIVVLGKRPSKIIKEMVLGDNIENRDITSERYIKYRNDIISCLK